MCAGSLRVSAGFFLNVERERTTCASSLTMRHCATGILQRSFCAFALTWKWMVWVDARLRQLFCESQGVVYEIMLQFVYVSSARTVGRSYRTWMDTGPLQSVYIVSLTTRLQEEVYFQNRLNWRLFSFTAKY